MEEYFKLYYDVLKDLDNAGVLSKVMLVGSWCQDVYRHYYQNVYFIPATRTKDMDICISRQCKFSPSKNLDEILKKKGFVPLHSITSDVVKYKHEEFTLEFLTNTGAKADEAGRMIPSLNIIAQELQFMNIPLAYPMTVKYHDVRITIPEPEAFTLHKLIVSRRRTNPEKRFKDTETVRGMFDFIRENHTRVARLHKIFGEFPNGWKKRVMEALNAAEMELPS